MNPHRHLGNRRPIAALAIAASLLLAGCAASHSPGETSGSTASGTAATGDTFAGSISIVASTDVYGDIAQQIGGDRVTVTSIINSPNQDPHDFQADARSQLALSKADVVIENGGGYDDFIDTMMSALHDNDIQLLNVADISGYDQHPANGEFNEHLWYDFPTMDKLVSALADTLATLDPDAAGTFHGNADAFSASLAALHEETGTLRDTYAGAGVLMTEPLPLYLTEAAGLVDKTIPDFSEAMEEGTDVSPIVLRDTLASLKSFSVRVLLYNEQTSNAQSETIVNAAKADFVPTVAITETLPAGTDYVSWMRANVTALGSALESGAHQDATQNG